jgi:hypothetical protein
MYNVIKFQAPFERIKHFNASNEVSLYKAIITQAIIDATNTSDERAAKDIEVDAKGWLFGNSPYFQEICYRAEIEPSFVVKIAKDAIKLNREKNASYGGKKQKNIVNSMEVRYAMGG